MSKRFSAWASIVLLALSWFFVAPSVLVHVYYRVTGPTDYDDIIAALRGLRTAPPTAEPAVGEALRAHGRIRTAWRIGDSAWHRETEFYASGHSLGFVASRHTEGEKYGGYDSATYLAWFEKSLSPRFVAINRYGNQIPQAYDIDISGIWPLLLVVGIVMAWAVLAIRNSRKVSSSATA